MKLVSLLMAISVVTLILARPAEAHFGMLIPSDTMVMQTEDRTVKLKLSFSHPMEMVGMDLETPKVFGVWAHDRTIDLTGSLRQIDLLDHTAWESDYKINRPGTHWFYMEPQPFWEPAEDCFIIHYTKAAVAAFGDDEGWDAEIGLKTEIVPLSKPFGLYAHNLFQGIVKVDGAPIPFASVEIEFYNQARSAVAPTDYMITHTIKADANGIFSWVAPRSGWWGFSALNRADYKLQKDGQKKEVELGAVLWVHFEDWIEK